MTIIFKAEDHSYHSLDPNEKIDWIGATTFVSFFKEKFDADTQSVKSAKNKKSKWYGLSPDQIKEHWNNESERARNAGTFYHNQRESDILELDTIQHSGRNIPVIRPIYVDGIKYAPDQQLTEGIYPEHFVYLKSVGVCGQSDRVEVVKDVINVVDYKTNKEIKLEGFKNWQGSTKKMLGPCAALDDCNFNHYALQLSLYMYIMLKHNPRYKPGKLVLHHVLFEKAGEDKFGYPILKMNENNEPIVDKIVPYEVPYLKNEVIGMLHWLQDNRHDLTNIKF